MNPSRDFTKLKKKLFENPEALRIIKGKEKEYHKAVMIDDYAENDAVKLLINELTDRITEIDDVLKNDRNLTEHERFLLFQKRDDHEWLLDFFMPSKAVIQQVEKFIKENIDHLK